MVSCVCLFVSGFSPWPDVQVAVETNPPCQDVEIPHDLCQPVFESFGNSSSSSEPLPKFNDAEEKMDFYVPSADMPVHLKLKAVQFNQALSRFPQPIECKFQEPRPSAFVGVQSAKVPVDQTREAEALAGGNYFLRGGKRYRRVKRGHLMREHLREAQKVLHPYRERLEIGGLLVTVQYRNQKMSPEELIRERDMFCKLLDEAAAISVPLNEWELSQLHPDIRDVHQRLGDNGETEGKNRPRKANLVMMEGLLSWAKHPDGELMSILKHGGLMVGRNPSCPVWPARTKKKKTEPLSKIPSRIEKAWNEARLAAQRSTEHDQLMYDKSMADVKRGLSSGPFETREEVEQHLFERFALSGAYSESQHAQQVEYDKNVSLPAPRFADIQQRPVIKDGKRTTTEKVRAIDNPSRGANLFAEQPDKMICSSPWKVAGQIRLAKTVFPNQSIHLGALDEVSAYRTIPVAVSDRRWIITSQRDPSGKQCFFVLKACCFGSSVAPTLYCRKMALYISVSRKMSVPTDSFFDDVWAVERGSTIASAFRLLRALERAMGWNFVSDKTQQPHISSTLLGVAFETDPDTIMRLTPEKRGAYIDKIDEALKEGVLTSPQALSIVSKIIWASAVFDNPAEFKHFLAILKRRAYAKPRDSSMSEEIREALLAIRNSLQCSQPKKIPDFRFSSSSQSELNGEHYCIYSDAMQSRSPASLYLEDERLRMGTGGTLFHPASIGAKPWAFNDRVSQSDLREMTERETQILNAELLAVKRFSRNFRSSHGFFFSSSMVHRQPSSFQLLVLGR